MQLKMRRADIGRITAIAEYFLSIIDEGSYESNVMMHTTEFYCQINNLVNQVLLKVYYPKKNDRTVISYLATMDYASLEEIAKDLNINLFEYMAKGQLL
jgi:hypothetical protein